MLQGGELLGPEVGHLGRITRREREELQHVEPEEAVGLDQSELTGDHRPTIAAVDAVRVVAEPAHEDVVGGGHTRHRPAAFDDRHAVPEARHRRDDDVEGVLGATSVCDRVRERADHVEEVQDRPGVGVREQERCRAFLSGVDVQEMDRLSVDLGQELVVLVEPCLDRPPVEGGAPLVEEFAKVGVRDAVGPVVAGCRAGEPSAREPLCEVVQVCLRDFDAERAKVGLVCVHGSTLALDAHLSWVSIAPRWPAEAQPEAPRRAPARPGGAAARPELLEGRLACRHAQRMVRRANSYLHRQIRLTCQIVGVAGRSRGTGA